MRNNLKRLLSAFCALSVAATMSALPVLADADADAVQTFETTELQTNAAVPYNVDYTADGATAADWTAGGYNANTLAVSSDGLLMTNTATGGPRYSGIAFDSAVSDSVIVEYEAQFKINQTSNVWIGSVPSKVNEGSSSSMVAALSITGGSAGTANGVAFTMPGSGITTPVMKVTHIINASSKKVTTNIVNAEDNSVIYKGTSDYMSSSLTSFSAFGIQVGKDSSTVLLKNLSVRKATVPTVTLEDVNRIGVGESAKIAAVSGASSVEVSLTNSDDFSYSIDGDEVTISSKAESKSGASTTATVSATSADGVTISESVTVTAYTPEEIVDFVKEEIEFSGSNVSEADGNTDTFNVLGDFTVPVTNGVATISWASDNNLVTIGEDGKVSISTATGTITLTATVMYHAAQATRTFTIIIPSNKVYYNTDFESDAVSTIATVDGPGTGTVSGMDVTVVTRSGSNGCNYVKVEKDAAKGNYLHIVTSGYNVSDGGVGNQRQTYITMTKLADATISNSLYINFDVKFAKTTSSLQFNDGTSNSVAINANMAGSYGVLDVDTWYNVTLSSDVNEKTTTITVKDNDGNVLSEHTTDYIKNLTKILTDGVNDIDFSLDNLVVADAIVPVINQTASTVVLGQSATVATVKNANTVDVSVDNTADFSVAYENGNVVLTSKGSTASNANVTVTGDSEGIKISKTFKVAALNKSEVTDASKNVSTVAYAQDSAQAVLSADLKGSDVIFSDIKLPASETVTVGGLEHKVDLAWSVVSGGEYLSNNGVLSLSDTDAHDVTLRKTISYSSNGTLINEDYVDFPIKVQFNPTDVEAKVKAAVAAANEKITDESAKLDESKYLKAFVTDYQVKFDSALNSNFDIGLPSTITSESTYNIPSTAKFGSAITWSSNLVSPIVVFSQSKGTVKFTPQSSTKTAKLSATLTAGSSSAEKSDVATVTLKGKNNTTGGGGGSTTSSNKGGTVAGSGTGTVSPSTPSQTLNPNPSGFTDLGSVSWALTAINNLYVNGVINGKSANEFCPNDSITRAEFAKILIKAFNIAETTAESATFYDVPVSHWASAYVETAFAKGIIKGYEDGSFDPSANVSRQDMAVMVLRAAEAAGYSFSEKTEAVTFTDDSNIASYAKTAIETLQKAGVVSGVENGAFAPLSTSTRAQACQIIYNVFNK